MNKNAKTRFDESMQRCDALLELAEKSPLKEEVLRFVVVLCVAALDMYASDRFMENFSQHIRHRTLKANEIDLLKKAGVTVEVVLNLLRRQKKGAHPFRAIRKYVDKYFAKASRQSFAKINDLYSYYGLGQLTNDALKKCGKKTVGKRVQRMLDRRHKIVHEADYDGKHKLTKLKKNVVCEWRKATASFVGCMEEILCNKFCAKRRNDKKEKLI